MDQDGIDGLAPETLVKAVQLQRELELQGHLGGLSAQQKAEFLSRWERWAREHRKVNGAQERRAGQHLVLVAGAEPDDPRA